LLRYGGPSYFALPTVGADVLHQAPTVIRACLHAHIPAGDPCTKLPVRGSVIDLPGMNGLTSIH